MHVHEKVINFLRPDEDRDVNGFGTVDVHLSRRSARWDGLAPG